MPQFEYTVKNKLRRMINILRVKKEKGPDEQSGYNDHAQAPNQ